MHKKMRLKLRASVVIFAIAAGGILLLIPPAFLSRQQTGAAAIMIVTISLWATAIIPEYLTALCFFLFAVLFSVSPPQVVFSGFQSSALWLIFGGLVIGIGIAGSGLGRRIAAKLVVRLEGSYFKLISSVVAVGILFAFLMPSALGRVILLAPVVIEMAKHFGFAEGSNGRTGMILAAVLGTVIPAGTILPANVPNMVLAGMAETQFDISLLYGEYLLLHFPVLGALKAMVITGLILWAYPDRPQKRKAGETVKLGPISGKETILSAIIAILLLLWMTDFIHHISPAWIALGGALLLMLPGIDVVSSMQFNRKVNYGSMFFIAGILGFGAMVAHTGLGETLAQRLMAVMPLSEDRPLLNYMLLGFASAFTGIAMTQPGIPAVMTPLCDSLAQVTGLPVKTVLMTQVVGFSTILLPYQAPPIVVGLQAAGEKSAAATKICLILAATTVLFLWPVDYFWWKLLGWL